MGWRGEGAGAGPLAGQGAWDLAALNFPSFIHFFQHGLSSCPMSGIVQGSGDSVGSKTAPGWALGGTRLDLWKDFNAVGMENNYCTSELEGLQETLLLVHFTDGEVEALRWETTCPSPLSWLGLSQTLESELCPPSWALIVQLYWYALLVMIPM